MTDDPIDDEGDLPEDPDWETVPEELRLLADEQVVTTQVVTDEGVDPPGSVVIVPGLFGHADRLRRGFYDDEQGDTPQ